MQQHMCMHSATHQRIPMFCTRSWLQAKYISPNVKRRSAEGGLPSELVEQHKHAMMAVQKFQALMLDNQGEQHGIAVCQKNQEALRELRDVIRRLVVNEAKVLTVSMISELFSSDELLELQAAMDTFAAQRGDQLLVLPFVQFQVRASHTCLRKDVCVCTCACGTRLRVHILCVARVASRVWLRRCKHTCTHLQLDESEQKEMVERLSWADKRKLHEGTEKYTDTWRFSHNAPTKPLQEKTIFESSCCACRKGPRPFAMKTPPPADRPKR